MSIFPFVISEAQAEPDEGLPEFKELAYDFEQNCLLKKAGKYFLVVRNQALEIWIYKALKTKRFAYQAYTHNFGTEVDHVIGMSNREIIESEIRRYVTETIMVNPYIQELYNFEYDWKSKAACVVSFDVVSIYDRFSWSSEVYVT